MEYFDRFSSFFDQGHFQPDQQGRYMVHDRQCLMFDLSNVNIVASTVDTVRQLYRLQLDQPFLLELHELYEQALTSLQTYHLHGYDFAVSSGGQSGYKYKLQNNELGVIIFIKNRRQKPDAFGSHLKIELSLKYLIQNSVRDTQMFMDAVAVWCGQAVERAGVAIHLATDVQGWEPSEDFLERLSTRSTRMVGYDAVEKAEFNLSEVAVTYGDRQTITVGSVSSVQMCVYDKVAESVKSDKLHLMRSIWSGEYKPVDDFCFGSESTYDPLAGVRRLEMRFHHTVLRQFERGSNCDMSCYETAFEHLGELWRYAMKIFRLDYNDKLIDPVWQLLAEDSDFNQCHTGKSYRRAYKKPGEGNEKNVALALGNWLSIVARSGMTAQKAWRYLKVSGMFKDIKQYYKQRGVGLDGLYMVVSDGLKQRRLAGRVAA